MELINKMKQQIHRDAVISLFDCEDDVKIFTDKVESNESLKNGIDFAVIDDHGETIFHHVIKTGQNVIFDHLVERVGGIKRLLLELKLKDSSGNNLVMTAVQYENWEILQKLVGQESGLDTSEKLPICEELNKVKFGCLSK